MRPLADPLEVLIPAADMPAALAALRRARSLQARAPKAARWTRALLALTAGNLYHGLDRHGEALAAYGEARDLFRRAGEERGLATIDYNRANILVTLDRTEDARRLYQKALDCFTERRQVALAAQTEYALAGIELLEGRLDDAIVRLARTRVCQTGLHDPFRSGYNRRYGTDQVYILAGSRAVARLPPGLS